MPIRLLSLIACCVALHGCTQLGARHIEAERHSYTDVIALSDKQELLSNIVRAKYNDPPVFLQIKTITVAPSLKFSGNANVAYDSAASDVRSTLGPSIEYRNEPRIILAPLEGTAFANELLVPTGLMPVYLMLINGFSFEKVANLMLISVNEISNRRSAPKAERQKFQQAVALIQKLLDEDVIYVTVSAQSVMEGITDLTVKIREDKDFYPELLSLLALLDISIEDRDIPITIGQEAGVNKITVHTRSLLSVINYLSNYVEIPEQDLGKVWETDFTDETNRPIHVRVSDSQPGIADVAVLHRNKWFYIEDTDIDSQNALYLLRVMFDLQAERNGDTTNLLLTLPVQ